MVDAHFTNEQQNDAQSQRLDTAADYKVVAAWEFLYEACFRWNKCKMCVLI